MVAQSFIYARRAAAAELAARVADVFNSLDGRRRLGEPLGLEDGAGLAEAPRTAVRAVDRLLRAIDAAVGR